MLEKDDVKIVEECLKGNRKAFETLVDKYQKAVFNGAYRMLDHYDDAKDVSQTVFIKVFENLRSFDPKYRFFSWMYRILVNESLNFLNQRKRLSRHQTDQVPDKTHSKDTISSIELQSDIQHALMALGPHYRAVIIMRHLEGFTYEEMSDILGLPQKTVKSRLFSARRILKDILIQRGYVTHD